MSLIIILVGLTLSVADGIRYSTAVSRARAELAALAQGLEGYKNFYGDYPWIDGVDPLANAKFLYAALNSKWKWDSEAQNFKLSSKGKIF